MNDSDNLWITEHHATSMRWVIIEDDGQVAWMYLTEPQSQHPIADCWLYNRVPTPARFEHREGAPIVPATHSFDNASIAPPKPDSVGVLWSSDGESVAVFFGSELIGFIVQGEPRGYSRFIRKSGPFGHNLNKDLFNSTFGRMH